MVAKPKQPARGQQTSTSKSPVTFVGDPINFGPLARAPLNEHGVIYLFGVLAERLGLQVEAIRKDFPDCIARRTVGKGKWKEVRIEFEFESRNFLTHRHDPDKADMIVCWKHTWQDCPSHIEVLELEKLVRDGEALALAIRGGKKELGAFNEFMRVHRLQGMTMAQAAKLWNQQAGPKPARDPGDAQPTYQAFVRKQRLNGKSLAEAARLWNARKAGKTEG